jgi:hypothetical protein
MIQPTSFDAGSNWVSLTSGVGEFSAVGDPEVRISHTRRRDISVRWMSM